MINSQEIPDWLRWLAWTSIILAASAALIISADIIAGRRQKMAVMNFVWPITALYFGPSPSGSTGSSGEARHRPANPILERKPFGNNVRRRQPLWSWLRHGGFCWRMAGFPERVRYCRFRALGGLCSRFSVCIFTGYLISVLRHCSDAELVGWPGIVAAIKADTISLASFEIGMFAWMAFSGKVVFRSRLEPNQMPYWFSMQIAMVVGFATAFPANWWLIRKRIKEAM